MRDVAVKVVKREDMDQVQTRVAGPPFASSVVVSTANCSDISSGSPESFGLIIARLQLATCEAGNVANDTEAYGQSVVPGQQPWETLRVTNLPEAFFACIECVA